MVSDRSLSNLTRKGLGRKRGARNKLSKAMFDLMNRVLNDPEYQEKLIARIKAGQARHIEELFMLHAMGRPPTDVKVEVRRPWGEVVISLPPKDALPGEAPRALPAGEAEDDDELTH